MSSVSGKTIRLEQGRPTLLKEGDVIHLTRSTEANPDSEVISYKYCSSPFPRITKYKTETALRQDSTGMFEYQAENITKADKANTRIHLKRQREPYGQQSSPRKVRFKVQVEESIDDHNPFSGSRGKDDKNSTEGLEDRADSVGFRDPGKGSVAVKELNDTILYIDNTTAFNNDVQSITHSTTSSTHVSATSSSTESPSELSKICRSEKKHDSLSLEEETTKSEAFEQASDSSEAEDGAHYDKCDHCGKWIPLVTLSLHEAVCEGQSQEAKSQDHVSLSSLPLGDCSFSGVTTSKIQRLENCLLNEGDVTVSGEASEPEVTGQIDYGESDKNKIKDEACKKTTIETVTTLRSTNYNLLDGSTESSIISASTVNTNCESRGKIEENTITKISNSSLEHSRLLLGSDNEDAGFTSPHQCEPTISREESKERCTFCSKVLPVSELIAHSVECSKMSAVPRTDADDTENMYEACPYCGKYFEVLELVEHVICCKEVSRLKAEEISLKDGSPSSPVIGAVDCGEKPSVGDGELLNHADECKEEPLSTSSDVVSPREDAKDPDSSVGDKCVENVVHNDGKDGTGDEVCESCDGLDRDKSKRDVHISSSDATCGDKDDRIAEANHDVDGGSVFDDVNGDENREEEETDVDDEDEENDDVDDDKSSRRDTDDGDITRVGSCYDDDSHSDTNDDDSKSDEEDVKSDEYSTHTNKCRENEGSVDDFVDAKPYSEVSAPSDEFELCPNCFQLFHLSHLVEHASNCVFLSDVSALNKAVGPAKETDFKASPLFNPSIESAIVFSDCHFCGVRLPVDVLSVHYPKCKKLHFQRIINEGSSSIEKSDFAKEPLVSRAKARLAKMGVKGSGDENEGLAGHVIRIDNLSTRTAIKGERTMKRFAISAKASDESPKSSKSKAAKLQDADDGDGDDREAGESKVSLKKTTSSLDSYHDCEEQCIYCLKMFAVSVLVEHVCSCADRYEVRNFDENVPF